MAVKHDRDIIHRDIKAENVFLSVRGIVKLGDLGFSTKLQQGPQERLRTFCGSPPYAAPELFRDESYVGCKVDVWALGVLIYFMVTAQMPFPGENLNTLKKAILLGVITFPSALSLTCRSLIIYEKTQNQLQNDKKWQHETSLGKRVALYKLQNELGRGNFSTVKMAIHEVTKGKTY
ncbi:serine/threonine-protein kinase NIM1-like [Diaphorina citri]|uniref:Serine/threonine-protein kinase NIM1-like n=1 Tax=Diaphorina citri TaxID=121845 RepID=A0A1S3D4S8_DIACI|nr:serine/threonine-protein kinase NIM1-like [Diaphorina citri]